MARPPRPCVFFLAGRAGRSPGPQPSPPRHSGFFPDFRRCSALSCVIVRRRRVGETTGPLFFFLGRRDARRPRRPPAGPKTPPRSRAANPPHRRVAWGAAGGAGRAADLRGGRRAGDGRQRRRDADGSVQGDRAAPTQRTRPY